jgi:hypothetical protein
LDFRNLFFRASCRPTNKSEIIQLNQKSMQILFMYDFQLKSKRKNHLNLIRIWSSHNPSCLSQTFDSICFYFNFVFTCSEPLMITCNSYNFKMITTFENLFCNILKRIKSRSIVIP